MSDTAILDGSKAVSSERREDVELESLLLVSSILNED